MRRVHARTVLPAAMAAAIATADKQRLSLDHRSVSERWFLFSWSCSCADGQKRLKARSHTASNELAGIKNAARIECLLDRAMNVADLFGHSHRPPPSFCKADAMFAGDGSPPGEHLLEQLIERLL